MQFFFELALIDDHVLPTVKTNSDSTINTCVFQIAMFSAYNLPLVACGNIARASIGRIGQFGPRKSNHPSVSGDNNVDGKMQNKTGRKPFIINKIIE